MSTVYVPPSARPPVRRFRGLKKLLSTLVVKILASTAALWASGVRPWTLFAKQTDLLTTRIIDRGQIRTSVVESGSIESSDNATVRCMVEAFMGVVGGATTKGGASPSKAATTTTSSTSATKATSTTASGTSSTAKSASSSATTTAAATGNSGAVKPTIRSFTLTVATHTPLRGASSTAASAKGKSQGGNRGGGGGDLSQEKSGSTRILTIVPEGQWVKAGETICVLDSATFRDELQAQRIRWAQAKSFVDQANSILEVSKISLDEYRNGVYPRDLQQVDKYINICEVQVKQARDNLNWSKEMTSKHFQSESQQKATEYALEQFEIALNEARGMRDRLVNYTGPRLIKNLEAKIAAVQSDVLAQESSFKLEDIRQAKLQQMIDYCTLKAPRDGLVAYASDVSGGGPRQTTTRVQEGLAVRQGQAIVMLPDPRKVQVKVRVNESKVSQIHEGQVCDVSVEAFPDHPMIGTVEQITGIPAANGGSSPDVKLYYAVVSLGEGFEGLRTGMSAEVTFRGVVKSDVVRVPLASIRFVEEEPFVAVRRSNSKEFDWRRLELGILDRYYAEVLSGLKPGEAIVAEPDALIPVPPKTTRPFRKLATDVAERIE